MQFKTSIIRIGNSSTYMLVPEEVVDWLQLDVGQEKVIIEDKTGSKGKFLAIWKNEGK